MMIVVNSSETADSSSVVTVDAMRAGLMQVVTVHSAMFEKLLFQGDDLPLDLAELFEDVANTYLGFSENISRLHLARRHEAEDRLETRILCARR
jgi:hypothetical protein